MNSPSPPNASLFITTFEMPRHLELVCLGVERQSTRNFEVLFCDDGSGAETAEVIRDFVTRSGIPTQHCWQENRGFRKCRILNQAVRMARGSVFIFLDGDCIPHRRFIEDHLDAQEKGRYLAGRRVELGPVFSGNLKPENVRQGCFDWPSASLIWSAVKGDSEFLNRAIRIPSPTLRSWMGMGRIVDMKGCNYSLSREDLIAINGFDEEYEGYGREDTDVEIRLRNYGLRIKSLKGTALQFHIWHERRDFTPSNDLRLKELAASSRFICKQGLVPL